MLQETLWWRIYGHNLRQWPLLTSSFMLSNTFSVKLPQIFMCPYVIISGTISCVDRDVEMWSFWRQFNGFNERWEKMRVDSGPYPGSSKWNTWLANKLVGFTEQSVLLWEFWEISLKVLANSRKVAVYIVDKICNFEQIHWQGLILCYNMELSFRNIKEARKIWNAQKLR